MQNIGTIQGISLDIVYECLILQAHYFVIYTDL